MTADVPNDEFMELLEALCRDELTRAQQARLQQLVRGDEELRRIYVRYLHMHVCLRQAYAQSGAATFPQATPTKGASPRLFGSWKRFVGLAASILLLIGGGLVWQFAERDSSVAAAKPVGVLTRAFGCVWEGAQKPVPGTNLRAGRLELLAGMAEITCASGAVLLVEAPASLGLSDASRGFLHTGRLVIRVPAEANKFVLETRNARLLDIGTEFGVDANNSGETVVQVFAGIVVADLKQDKRGARSQRLTAGQTMQIGDDGPRLRTSTTRHFIRRFPVVSERDMQGTPPPNNQGRYDRVHIVPAPAALTIDGDLSDWDRSGLFSSACVEPYAKAYHVQGCMMYDRRFLYIGAHVGDPAPMCSTIDPETDPLIGWKGGSVQVRLSSARAFGWPLAGQGGSVGKDYKPHPQDRSDQLLHLTLWYYKPKNKACLAVEYGMNLHGARANPPGYRGAFCKDADGRGYTLEYAIPWDLLNAGKDPPQGGDVLGACWNIIWSDEEGRFWRGHLVDIVNPKEEGLTFRRAATWGKAIYHRTGHLPPGSVLPR